MAVQVEREFVGVEEARAIARIGEYALRRRIADGVLPTYVDHRNQRRILLKRADLEALTQPVLRQAAHAGA